jgi:hypothetical protein
MTDQQRNEKRQRHPTAQDEDVGSCCWQRREKVLGGCLNGSGWNLGALHSCSSTRARQSESTVMFNLQGAGQQKNRESAGGEGDLMFGDHYLRIPDCHRKSRTGLELERNQRGSDVEIVIRIMKFTSLINLSDRRSSLIFLLRSKGISKVHL